MNNLIDKAAVVAEIERRVKSLNKDRDFNYLQIKELEALLSSLNTLEVKENKLLNPRFPHLGNIVDKVFGAGNLESWEYEEAKQLVLLAKEELLKDLEVKEVDLDYIKDELDRVVKIYKSDGDFGWGTLYNIATHFYELGLRCKSSYVSIPNIDDTLEEMGVDPDSKSAKIFKEFYYMALEKFKAQKGEKV